VCVLAVSVLTRKGLGMRATTSWSDINLFFFFPIEIVECLPAKASWHARHYVLEIIVNVPDEYPCVFVCVECVFVCVECVFVCVECVFSCVECVFVCVECVFVCVECVFGRARLYSRSWEDKCRARPQMLHSTRGERECMFERKGKREGGWK
jgi:hypothetical protein